MSRDELKALLRKWLDDNLSKGFVRASSSPAATTNERTQAISRLAFPRTAHELERYLGMTGRLRKFIPAYVQLVLPLQNRKTFLFQRSPSHKGRARRGFATRTDLTKPTTSELQAFNTLQANSPRNYT